MAVITRERGIRAILENPQEPIDFRGQVLNPTLTFLIFEQALAVMTPKVGYESQFVNEQALKGLLLILFPYSADPINHGSHTTDNSFTAKVTLPTEVDCLDTSHNLKFDEGYLTSHQKQNSMHSEKTTVEYTRKPDYLKLIRTPNRITKSSESTNKTVVWELGKTQNGLVVARRDYVGKMQTPAVIIREISELSKITPVRNAFYEFSTTIEGIEFPQKALDKIEFLRSET